MMGKDFDFGELSLEFLDNNQAAASFVAKDIHSGPERRAQHRRMANDRRTDLRFEPGKCIERRYKSDRRHGNGWNSNSAI
jgi:hypothetical protein